MPTANMKLAECKALPQKRSKYRNKPVIVDGLRFDSKREAARWQELKLLHRDRKITGLQRQVRVGLYVPHHETKEPTRWCVWVADFTYWEDGELIHEDCKGFRTDVYKLKRNFLAIAAGIKIRET